MNSYPNKLEKRTNYTQRLIQDLKTNYCNLSYNGLKKKNTTMSKDIKK